MSYIKHYGDINPPILSEEEMKKAESDFQAWKNATNLERIRRGRGFSRAKLGELTGISFRTLESYEHRHRDFNSCAVSLAVKIADVLGVDVHELLEKEQTDET